MTATEPLTLQLPPTATFARRRLTWLASAGSDVLGIVRITCHAVKNRNRDSDPSKVYAVMRHPDPFPAGVRAFLLRCEDNEAGDVYGVTVGPRGESCTCKAASCRVPTGCKHVSAVLALLAAEVL